MKQRFNSDGRHSSTQMKTKCPLSHTKLQGRKAEDAVSDVWAERSFIYGGMYTGATHQYDSTR